MLCATLLTTVLLAAQADVATEQNQAAIAFLHTLQTPSGGFVTIQPPKGSEAQPSLCTTRTAIKTFRLLGGELANREAVIRYLHACYDPKSGGFSDRPGAKPDAISTAVGLMICCELKLPVEPYLEAGLKFITDKTEGFEQIRMVAPALEQLGTRVPQADQWLKAIDRVRNPDGSYGRGPGKARTTALYVMTQFRLGGKPASKEAVLKVLREGQRADGGFGGDCAGRLRPRGLLSHRARAGLSRRAACPPGNPANIHRRLSEPRRRLRRASGGTLLAPRDVPCNHRAILA